MDNKNRCDLKGSKLLEHQIVDISTCNANRIKVRAFILSKLKLETLSCQLQGYLVFHGQIPGAHIFSIL